ncbi:MAG: glycosyl hydrolase, partial [Bacteroidota bacterium]
MFDVFLDNFTRTFQEFCTENGLKCRYQAYGTPFLMGMLEGYMIPDIPEANNWIYSAEMKDARWKWSKNHGYMIWNHYAAAGGHLKGRKIISNEAMTNTRGVFKTSLEEIKQHDDMNFISGMNHSVLHGYNYSPPEAGFPGWVRYGAYFSPQNTWWPYFDEWTSYNARLSYIFQDSEPRKSVAVMGPTGDIWSKVGLTRGYFHTHPWYLHELWQSLSQNGSSCEYLNEQVIRNAEMKDGKLVYGPMQYEALWLGGVQSMHPET